MLKKGEHIEGIPVDLETLIAQDVAAKKNLIADQNSTNKAIAIK